MLFLLLFGWLAYLQIAAWWCGGDGGGWVGSHTTTIFIEPKNGRASSATTAPAAVEYQVYVGCTWMILPFLRRIFYVVASYLSVSWKKIKEKIFLQIAPLQILEFVLRAYLFTLDFFYCMLIKGKPYFLCSSNHSRSIWCKKLDKLLYLSKNGIQFD